MVMLALQSVVWCQFSTHCLQGLWVYNTTDT